MAEDEHVPFSFQPGRWTEKPPQFTSLSQDEVWRYLRRETDSFRQVNRGWAFKEEGYVRNVRWNASDNSQICLARAICLPSLEKAPYTVSAWFASGTGRSMGGSCSCVAALSETRHHNAALLLSAENPREAVGDASSEQIQALRDGLCTGTPGLQWLEFRGAEEARPARPPLPIADDEDLWSRNARDAVYKHAESLPPLTDDERAEVTWSTIGQADNPRWHEKRRGRITASVFSAVIKCLKPEYLVKGILYPSPDYASEAMRYGRMHEGTAVAAYEQLMAAQVDSLEVHETGLHIHAVYSFVAASPDRIVTKDGEEGLLEVKCPSSKVGLTPLEACKQDKKLCCNEVGGETHLKKRHAYYYQVQGQMAVTGHKWCDFVVWTNNKTVARSTHTETIVFDEKFVEGELLPGLLYFAEHALFPEVLTGRIRRRRDLIAHGQYVYYKKYSAGFYVVEDGPGLKKQLRKLQ
ncbi:hypothetical protein HPB47_025929 [Ixodes persulcatus]|uniref:Uncharacterized protein n=1 Tax=Ixodes persulcatus TaxID=34615 RepID=A0AC60Q1Z3_IXOPE|nr:hypothetical protein HPB47_025929 [Ixodes persulcatus]